MILQVLCNLHISLHTVQKLLHAALPGHMALKSVLFRWDIAELKTGFHGFRLSLLQTCSTGSVGLKTSISASCSIRQYSSYILAVSSIRAVLMIGCTVPSEIMKTMCRVSIRHCLINPVETGVQNCVLYIPTDSFLCHQPQLVNCCHCGIDKRPAL